MHRCSHNHGHSQGSLPRGRPVNPEEGARASDYFEQFLTASTLKTILGSYRNICECLHLKPNVLPLFYPKLKSHINSWKAKALWKKFDSRANQKCYGRGKTCPHTRVLIIGAGPCGLRTAIEAQLLGAKVVVVEKRDRMSRNNVLHLWPFVIDDLRALGAKKFFGKFCAGSIDHISIRQLQCILLKVALLLGVEIHTEVSFEKLVEPNPSEKTGWHAEFKPTDHPASQFEFDVIIGADGKRNTLQGFKRKEFRGKLAIAITANFINKRTEAEARVEEISGVAFIFNQKFFKDLYVETGIDLENIVYYKDDTHYFVMTAKKQSLIDKAVIREDLSDTAKLLATENVDREELMNYAREAAEFSTNYQMPDLEFAVNHYGQPDVAMFDFTSMYAAENASRVIERHNYKLLSILVGDSLLEPFWPTGSGCARGFLSSMDAAWAIRSWGSDIATPLEVIAERESIYRLLAQTTPENLNKDYKSYTLDPSTRYPNLNKNVLLPHQVTNLYDTDDTKNIELSPKLAPTVIEVPKKRRRRESHVDPDILLSWINDQVREKEDLKVTNLTTSFKDGRILCAIINHYRPDLLDYSAINPDNVSRNNQIAFDILEKELGIMPMMTGEEMANTESPDFSLMLSYLTKIYDTFRCEIPHIKYPRWDENFTVTGTSAVVVPTPDYPLKPVLITPHSSAKISDYGTEYIVPSQYSLTNSHLLPTNVQDNLILTPIKSIERYLSKDSITMNGPGNQQWRENNSNNTKFRAKDMPEIKRNENMFKAQTAGENSKADIFTSVQPTRPSSRHKRHIDTSFTKSNTGIGQDRKTRKRKTLEKVGASVEDRQKRLEEIVNNKIDRQNKKRQQRKMQTEQFIKSMQMLQSNCKPDHSEPFEDYSIYLYRQTAPNFEDRVRDLEKKFIYVPDKESRILPVQTKRETDEDFAARIKNMEDKWREPASTEKKPKDLLRAIGKIETSDWNIKEIEKKIIENKLGKTMNKDKEKVPKWSREQFLARQTKMERQHLDQQSGAELKFAEIDKNIKQLEQKLKEGTVRDLNQHKIASITEKLVGKTGDTSEPLQTKQLPKTNSRSVIPINQAPEFCHFCSKRVYLVERLSAEGKIFHTGCFRCQYCHTSLRLGSYMFDREGLYGNRFYCTQHCGMTGEIQTNKVEKKPLELQNTSQTKVVSNVVAVDLLDRVQTPERIEFSNLSPGHISSDHDESPSPIDEDEWTDRNNINSVMDSDSSDDSSSNSNSDTDDEAYEEALEEPITKEGTLRWAERYKKRYSRKDKDESDSDEYSTSDHFSYYENSSGDDVSDTATEGEDEIRARELRKQEVRVEPPIDAGTDTEVASCETSSESSSEIQNSATEISTDSEFAHDDPTPTQETPKKIFDDFVTKTRGSYGQLKKVQVKSSILQQPINGRSQTKDIQLKFTPLIQTPILRKPALTSLFARNEGYALNRTQSTGGIATKVSLELKKKYLLGETNSMGCIQKSGSVSTLDSKFKSFHTNISDCQKLLKPAPEISASMQIFCSKLNERTSPLSPIFGAPVLFNKGKSSADLDLNLSPEQLSADKLIQVSKSEISKCVSASSIPEMIENKIVNESEGRPRSPLHEKQIIVPVIDWFKTKQKKEINFVDSLSSGSESDQNVILKSKTLSNIPRLEIHDDSGIILRDDEDTAFDSLNVNIKYNSRSNLNELGKAIIAEKKTLNQPKILPGMASDLVHSEYHSALHIKQKSEGNIINKDGNGKSIKDSSGRSTPSVNDDAGMTAFTETELDDFEDVEYELISEIQALNSSNEQLKYSSNKIATVNKLSTAVDDLEFARKVEVVGKNTESAPFIESVNILNLNIDNIEFMDTGTETSSDDNLAMKNNGYIQFHNDEEFVEDSLSPALNNFNIIETVNPSISTLGISNGETTKILTQSNLNTIESRKPNFNVCEANSLDPNHLNNKKICDNKDDIVVMEADTTTEENTCSDATVKNITEKIIVEKPQIDFTNTILESNKLEVAHKINENSVEINKPLNENVYTNNSSNHEDFSDFKEHCQRLQSKIEFSNVKDSIDIKKTRRKSKTDITKPDLIQEEKDKTNNSKQIENILTPTILSKKEKIETERNLNKKLIQEMVMTKMRAQNKSLERKKRIRNSFSPIRPTTTELSNKNNLHASQSPTPDVLLSTIPVPLQKSQTSVLLSNEKNAVLIKENNCELEINDTKTILVISADNLPDTSKTNDELLSSSKNSLKTENEKTEKTLEMFQQSAKTPCRPSGKDRSLNPEDKLIKLKQKTSRKTKENKSIDIHIQDSIESLVVNTERRNSLLYSNDTLKRNTSFRRSKSGDATINVLNNTELVTKLNIGCTDKISPPIRTKSVSEISKFLHISNTDIINECSSTSICKSYPNLLITSRKQTKKPKDRERRKSITKLITELFSKKKDSPCYGTSKGFLFRISPKNKNKSKSWFDLDLSKIKRADEELCLRRNSISEINLTQGIDGNVSPPPIPPLPTNYVRRQSLKDENSDPENEFGQDLSSCETLDQSEPHVTSLPGCSSRKLSRSARKTARQAQLKRHRMAQEIQRKLEETEVKTRELELRGVQVEKALRGESSGSAVDENKEESQLLKEWFDLMRDRTELRRYEKELIVRAQELELEDRHARLQHELRERLENNKPKTKQEMELEGDIIKEMMDIVAKRDSLINLLEEDRLRYFEEDRDFEEQILAKGIHLTPLVKSLNIK